MTFFLIHNVFMGKVFTLIIIRLCCVIIAIIPCQFSRMYLALANVSHIAVENRNTFVN